MEPAKTATEANALPIAAEEKAVITPEDDAEARFAQLEAEKENYRKAYLREAAKNKTGDESFSEDDVIERKVNEAIAKTRLAEIAREQDTLIQKVLKENKELKLAHLTQKKDPPAAIGTSGDSTPVRDSSISQDQLAFFKSRGWTDKDIERYKKNLQKRI